MRRHTPPVAFLLLILTTAGAFAQSADSGDRGDRRQKFSRHRKDQSAADGEGSGSYELRGFFGAGHETEVSLRVSGTDKAYWIRVGDKVDDLYVEKVDPVVGTAVIVTHGTRYRLRLAGEMPPSARAVPQALQDQNTTTMAVNTTTMTVVRVDAQPAQEARPAQTAPAAEGAAAVPVQVTPPAPAPADSSQPSGR